MADAREGEAFFLNVPEKLDNPFPDLKYFRETHPVFFYPPLESWFIFRYDDVSSLLHDERLSANRMRGFVDAAPAEVRGDLRRIAPYMEAFMLMKDGSDHVRVRAGMRQGLNPDVIHRLGDSIQRCVDELLDLAKDRDHLDAAGEFAFLLPAYVLSDLFGVHKEDRGKIVEWSVAFVDFFNILPISVDTSRRFLQSGFALMDYTRGLIAERRANPEDDFLGALAAGQTQQGGLTEDEIASNIMLLLLAGHVAVRNLIGNTLYLLLTHPDQLARLEADPALLTNAIEETLRFESPISLIPRVAVEDLDLHGNVIRKGQLVQLSLASANRDAAHFPDGERFDITREPGRHLAFGIGPHGCFGAALAREIAHIALGTLLRRMPDLRLDESKEIRWYRNAGNRGPITLPLVFPGPDPVVGRAVCA
jgi:cytochrome P450